MILQTDSRLNTSINRWGCYLMSILFLVNKHTKKELSTDLINTYYQFFQDSGWMTDECYLDSPHLIMNYLGLANQVRYEDIGYRAKVNEYEILCFKRGKQKHFVVGDGLGHIAFDPMGVSKTTRYGRLQSKRIFWRA